MEWIDAEFELPPTDQIYYDIDGRCVDDLKTSIVVLVYTDENEYTLATLNQDYGKDGNKVGEPYWFDEREPDAGDWIKNHVTHWAFLPPPPVVIIT